MSGLMWIDLATGEIVPEDTPGAVCLPDDEDPSPCQRLLDEPDMSWLGDWLTRRLAEQDAAEGAEAAAHKARLLTLRAQRARLERWLPELERVAREQLAEQKGRGKSVVYAYGRAGWRRSKRVEVTDAEAAMAWAEEHAPDAVKVSRSLLKSLLPEDAPGVEVVEEDRFSVTPAKRGAS